MSLTSPTISQSKPQLPSLSKHSQELSTGTSQILHTLTHDQILVDELTKIQASSDQTQRQLNLLTDHVDKSIDVLDELEIATLPLLVERCHDLEKVYANIDQLYALVKEIEFGLGALEARCDEIEQAQGSSASVRKNVGMWFKSILEVDPKGPQKKMPTQANMLTTAVPDFGLYINRNYVPEDQVKQILEEVNNNNNASTTPKPTPRPTEVATPVMAKGSLVPGAATTGGTGGQGSDGKMAQGTSVDTTAAAAPALVLGEEPGAYEDEEVEEIEYIDGGCNE